MALKGASAIGKPERLLPNQRQQIISVSLAARLGPFASCQEASVLQLLRSHFDKEQ